MLIATGCNEVIKLHHWPSCEHAKTFWLPYKGYAISSISWCTDSDLVAYSTSSKTYPVIFSSKEDYEDETPQEVKIPHIGTLCFATTRRTVLALGTDSGNVLLYDIQNQKLTRSLPIVPSAVQFLRFGARDEILAAGCANGLICVYNPEYNVKATFYMPETDRPITSMVCHTGTVNILAGGTADGIVAIWDTSNGNCLFKHKTHIGTVTDLAFSFRDDIATVGTDCCFKCYDMRHDRQVFSVKSDSKLTGVEFMSNDGEYIAVTTIDGKIYCYDRRHVAHPLNTIIAHHPKPIAKIAFQPHEVDDATSSSIDLSFSPGITHINSSDFAVEQFFSKNINVAPYAIVGQDCIYKLPEEESDETSEYNTFFVKNDIRQEAFDASFDKNSVSDVTKGIPELNLGACSTKRLIPNLQKNDVFTAVTNELKTFTEEMVNRLVEYIDEEFLRIRLTVGKGFVDLESRIHSRWECLGSSLFQFAGGDIGTDIGSGSGATVENNENVVDDRNSSLYVNNNQSNYRRMREDF